MNVALLLILGGLCGCIGDSPVTLPPDDRPSQPADLSDDPADPPPPTDGSADPSTEATSPSLLPVTERLPQEFQDLTEFQDVGILAVARRPNYPRYRPTYEEVQPGVALPNLSPGRYGPEKGETVEFHASVFNRSALDLTSGKGIWRFSDGRTPLEQPFTDFKRQTIKDFGLTWLHDPEEVVDLTFELVVDDARFRDAYERNNRVTVRTNATQLVLQVSLGADLAFTREHAALGLAGAVDWFQAHVEELNAILARSGLDPQHPCKARVFLHEVFYRSNNDEVFKPPAKGDPARELEHYLGLPLYARQDENYDAVFGLESTQTFLEERIQEWRGGRYFRPFFSLWLLKQGLVDPHSSAEVLEDRSLLANLSVRSGQLAFSTSAVLRDPEGKPCPTSTECLLHRTASPGYLPGDLSAERLSSLAVGLVESRFGRRGGLIGDILYALPTAARVVVHDRNGRPLSGVLIRVFQSAWDGEKIVLGGEAPQLFEGYSGQDGAFGLAERPPLRSIPTLPSGFALGPNPFGTIDAYGRNGVLAVELKAGTATELYFLDLVRFVEARLAGQRDEVEIVLRTGL
ncbi:MAG: hypothetical protein A2284_12060 [Deltaproteobacteria bacterium RIFOXYA12_FULL_61_11]|nr:MAG: hypothetical protein A2284_12060 [Deltaproteobacteria bacterium RIFOXYA12_FULL_61_11]